MQGLKSMNKLSIQEIASNIFSNNGRARDCGVREEVKQYGKFAEEILEKLAEIEIKHLNSLGA